VFPFHKHCQQETLHLLRLRYEVVERFQQLFEFLHPWIGAEEGRNDTLWMCIYFLQSDDVDIGQAFLFEMCVYVEQLVELEFIGVLRRDVPRDNVKAAKKKKNNND
jgi:hypothetical protein